jgi:hypothetical protein
MREGWTRRQVLLGGGVAAAAVAGLGVAGYAGYAWPHPKSSGGTRPAPAPAGRR